MKCDLITERMGGNSYVSKMRNFFFPPTTLQTTLHALAYWRTLESY
jgi:hypothetical protein